MNLLLLTAHAVAEYDDVRMFADLGYNIFSIGSYTRPYKTADPIRPPLPQAPYFPDLADMVEGDQMAHKEHLPDGLIDWADVIIVHHYPQHTAPNSTEERGWIVGQWERIKHKRVIWRTCGQSDPRLEARMAPYARDGLEIVRYSPREREFFESVGSFAGQSALIRFGKYPEDYGPWVGDDARVINISQGLGTRGEFTHPDFWLAATEGLPACAMGPESEVLGGPGALEYHDMIEALARARAYLYTGTQPASYTLGLMEAMLSGVPVVSIPASTMWMPGLFEGQDLVTMLPSANATSAHLALRALLRNYSEAALISAHQVARARELFDVATVGQQWVDFLGQP
jgi:glycosyltransferase involved in cell wall biosynthesis